MGNLPLQSERERVQFIKDMTLALFVETGEALQSVDWKPWRSDRETDREHFIEELVDCLHFVANLLVAVDVTDHEIAEAYMSKHRIVRSRQLST